MIHLPSSVFIVAYITCISSSAIQNSNNEGNGSGRWSHILDIHMAVEYDTTSLNLKNVINSAGSNKWLNNSVIQNPDEKGPVESNLATELNYLTAEVQTIENTLNGLLKEKEIGNRDLCGPKKTLLGVHYNSYTKTFANRTSYPKNCKEIQNNGNNVTGIYEIFPTYSKTPFFVLCDMENKGGGWTHIQKRFDGSQDFTLNWRDYKFGFGNLEGEFWLGLENIHVLTGFEVSELLVEIVDRDNVSAYAHYTSFAVGPEPEGYKLKHLSGFSGDAGDSLTYHLGQKFSTKDLDFTSNCAKSYIGGWWYKSCHESNLNAEYINIDLPSKYEYQGLQWQTFRSLKYCHSKSRMLVRPAK